MNGVAHRALPLLVTGAMTLGTVVGSSAMVGYYLAHRSDIDAVIAAIPTPTRDPRVRLTATPTPRPTIDPSAAAEAQPTRPRLSPAASSPSPVATPTVTTPPGPTPTRTPVLREQWGNAATASSEAGNPGYAAIQAAGAPNTPRCGDFETAWASNRRSRIEWIEVKFPIPVRATKVSIYETFNPGRVVQVDLREPNGALHTIFKGKDPTTACPGVFSPPFTPTTIPVNAV
ncbi:MAG: hypothetical protein NZ518_06060, partial [Dehalococcoidia bacterium]|nr:hypothetical protein [Dehalococcoidia bacterium]